jgi:16S rRNA (guanine(966)-N(2))-methyltransferase RsmD
MRVIAGEAKGRRLQVPHGRTVRPSGARWRESAFGIIEHRMSIAEARVLDLYAGSGALGIEALSRGARSLVAVEQDRETARVLARNAAACGLEERVELFVEPVVAALGRLAGRAFDLVLLDPPYESGEIAAVLASLAAKALVAPSGLVVVEHGRRDVVTAPASLTTELERRYGDSLLTLLRHRAGRVEVPVHAAS